MPNPVDNPEDWYRLANSDARAELSKQEVINALKATLPLDYTHLEREVEKEWLTWDSNNSGDISLEEFRAPGKGLLSYVYRHFQKHEPFPCSCCGEPMCTVGAIAGGGVAVLMQGNDRICKHYFHADCMAGKSKCPRCEKPFNRVHIMPHPSSDPGAWFSLVDVSGDGVLNKEEVLEAVKATLPINWKAFEAELAEVRDAAEGIIEEENLWLKWDHDGSGEISREEFIAQGGLLDYILCHYPIPEVRPVPKLIPGNRASYEQFFRYWDHALQGGDGSGQLEKHEMRRAIMKTFRQWQIGMEGIDEVIGRKPNFTRCAYIH